MSETAIPAMKAAEAGEAASPPGLALQQHYPYSIRLRYLPFWLQGWNSLLTITSEVSDGAPVYEMRPYVYLFYFRIIGIKIKRVNGKWGLTRDCDKGVFCIRKLTTKTESKDPLPLGDWEDGAQVVDPAATINHQAMFDVKYFVIHFIFTMLCLYLLGYSRK